MEWLLFRFSVKYFYDYMISSKSNSRNSIPNFCFVPTIFPTQPYQDFSFFFNIGKCHALLYLKK